MSYLKQLREAASPVIDYRGPHVEVIHDADEEVYIKVGKKRGG
jgi:hypothetical protein